MKVDSTERRTKTDRQKGENSFKKRKTEINKKRKRAKDSVK